MAGRLSLLGAGKQVTAAGVLTNPLTISGCTLWIDFSDADTMFTDAGTTKVSANDDKIYQVNDKSTSNKTAIQTTEANRPLYKTNARNGNSVANFNNNHWLVLSSVTTSTPITVFIAAFRTYPDYGVYLGYDVASYYSVIRNEAPNFIVLASGGTGVSEDLWGMSDGHLAVAITHASGGGEMKLYDKNNLYLTNAAVGGYLGNFSYIGMGKFGNLIGNFYEILIYNSVLSQANREAVTNYLMTKWGIT